MTENETKHWLVRPSTIRLLWVVFSVVLAALVLADLFLHPHPVFGIDGTFGFYAWYGLLTCIAMVLLAKALRPLPEKWHGLKDTELKLRQRYLDLLMSEETVRRFRQRTKVTRTLRVAVLVRRLSITAIIVVIL